MTIKFFGLRGCLVAIILGVFEALPCAAQSPSPAVRFCEVPTPISRAGRGIGTGSGRTTDDAVKEVFTPSEVTKKAEVLFRPEADYHASGSDSIAFEVKLRLVLCPRGYTSNIEILSKAPDDFIEKVVEAARNIRFIPGEKDGKRVAQYITVVYSHRVY